MATIPLVGASTATAAAAAPSASSAPGSDSATSVFEKLIAAVDGSTAAANDATSRMVEGTGEVHDAMIALQQADLALQFAVQIRNKLVQAYQEVSKMPV